jgi:GNAT superfamily N-acetyltransferase
MNIFTFEIVRPDNLHEIQLIAEWYFKEWNIPKETTIGKISSYNGEKIPFQLLMKMDGSPIATGGVYNHVGLLDYDPRYKKYGPWLALVYTSPENRKKGYGAILCEKIQDLSKEFGLNEIFLFTFTAESLYKKLGWQEIERLNYKGKDTVIMKKEL